MFTVCICVIFRINPTPTTTPPSDKCRYIECGIRESICGDECYSGRKVWNVIQTVLSFLLIITVANSESIKIIFLPDIKEDLCC